jgi:ABC-type multidrug transport system fused ATPase/permease subunit
MPWFFVFCFDAWTSSKRLQSYFKQYESYVRAVSDQDVTVDPQLNIERSNKDVTIRGLSLGYGKKEILKNINLEIERGEFVAIAGEVGAGKSSLLLAMIGEVGAKFEKCEVRGRWAFVPQESFIMNAQLHENVQMQYAEDYALAESVEESLRLASFASTQEGFEQGLKTQIGERGVNLSGGQKQRIALARAHRVDAEILFLDDVFSALDANTERAVLNDLVLGVWRKKTRVLITHRLSVLPLANRVIFMADGQIQDAGKFSDLLERNESFRQFVASIQTEEKTEASGTQEQI